MVLIFEPRVAVGDSEIQIPVICSNFRRDEMHMQYVLGFNVPSIITRHSNSTICSNRIQRPTNGRTDTYYLKGLREWFWAYPSACFPMTILMGVQCLKDRESYSFATALDSYKFDEYLAQPFFISS